MQGLSVKITYRIACTVCFSNTTIERVCMVRVRVLFSRGDIKFILLYKTFLYCSLSILTSTTDGGIKWHRRQATRAEDTVRRLQTTHWRPGVLYWPNVSNILPNYFQEHTAMLGLACCVMRPVQDEKHQFVNYLTSYFLPEWYCCYCYSYFF